MDEQESGAGKTANAMPLLPASTPAVQAPYLGRRFLLCDSNFLNRATLGTWIQVPGVPRLGAAGLLGASAD